MPKKYICVYYKINSKLLQNQTIYTVIVFLSISQLNLNTISFLHVF